ncbi:LTA synthase family protein [Pelosinus fermentans]|uniref:Sulfatase n=1 Tax=Pelosinus fermentans JBW45 TaxID=1192197 RepID=I9NSU3_9FIRM|nr:alkaline phosphatase family protein [Pelosinus fermentans]AJQ28805.1 sulfatase [Pelosinus fermentans JBW45]
MSRWEDLFKNIQQDIKLFVFVLGIFCLFRIGFIIILNSYISEAATFQDIAMALYYGIRISLKSTGLVVAASFIICTLLNMFNKGAIGINLRYILGCTYISLLSLLFYARIPYYEQFHMGFNQLLFNTFNDDVHALFYTLVEQYKLPVRLLLTGVTALVLCRLLKVWLGTKTYHLPCFSKWYGNIAFRTALLIIAYYLVIFIRFGGSMTYAYNIDWENSGVTKDEFLNEAILDDVQALYRAYTLHERIMASTGLDMDPQRMVEYGTYVAGHPVDSQKVDDFLKKEAQGGKIKKPQHVFLIIGESYANWPLLPQYKDLNIANGMRNIIAQEDAAYVPAFLPNGMSTISGIMGIVTGLAEANLYLTYLPESYKEPYSTSLAPQMKKLGYKPRFWYAGPTSWERVKDFTLAQGFEEFYGMGDIASQSGNVWGCDDKYLFQAVASGVDNPTPTFDVIMNISNHAPYTVDLEKEGFDRDSVISGLPDNVKEDQELIKKLGHFWYADKVMAEFIRDMRQQYPDSLFIIVGDHADRLNIQLNPSLYERYGIPFIVYGKGIDKNVFSKEVAGSHINVSPTILELLSPPGFVYYSLGESMTLGNGVGFNYGFWVTHDSIGKIGSDSKESMDGIKMTSALEENFIQRDIDARRAMSWWRIKNGKNMKFIE